MSKEKILINGTLLLQQLEKDLEHDYDVTLLRNQGDPMTFLREHGHQFTGLVTSAGARLPAEIIEALPNLKVISSFGVGYDQLNEEVINPRQIRVGYTPDVLNDCVADLAFGLMIDISRGLSSSDRYVRQGKWPSGPFPLQRRISGKRMGILGMGRIGEAIAKRATGFDMEIGYHNRNKRDDLPHTYLDSPSALAEWSDYLMVAVTGGAGTAKLVNADVLKALGTEGFLINISRGTVIDEEALLDALKARQIAGAALDVFTNEPHVPEGFFDLDNVVLLPHVASATHETRRAMADLVMENLRHYYATGEVHTAVPWSVGASN